MLALLSPLDLAAVVVVAAVITVALFRRGNRLELSVGDVKATVEDAVEKIEAVNHAVNNRPAGDPTLYEQVRAMALKLDDNSAATHAASRRVGDLAALLTAHIARHQAEDDAAADRRG